MNLRKLGGLAVIAFAVFYAITNPGDAAGFIPHHRGGRRLVRHRTRQRR